MKQDIFDRLINQLSAVCSRVKARLDKAGVTAKVAEVTSKALALIANILDKPLVKRIGATLSERGGQAYHLIIQSPITHKFVTTISRVGAVCANRVKASGVIDSGSVQKIKETGIPQKIIQGLTKAFERARDNLKKKMAKSEKSSVGKSNFKLAVPDFLKQGFSEVFKRLQERGISITLRKTGIYMDESHVYLCQLKRDIKGFTIEKHGQAPLGGPTEDKPFEEEKSVGQVIEAAAASLGIETKEACLALPSKDGFVRYYDMAKLPRKEWQKAARFEARKYTPFNINDIYYDVHVSSDKEKKRLGVVFAGARKDVTTKAVASVKEGGFKVEAVEPVFISLLRMHLMKKSKQKNETLMFIDLDKKGTVMTAIARGSVLLSARQSVVAPEEGGQIEPQSFIPEIRLSFDYFAKSFKQEQISRIVIAASNAYENVKLLVEQELLLPTEMINPLEPLGFKDVHAQGIGLACGAALNPLQLLKSCPLNLILVKKRPILEIPKMTPDQEKPFLQKIAIGEACLMVGIIAFVWIISSGNFMWVKHHYNKLESKYVELRDDRAKKSVGSLDSLQSDLMTRNSEVKQLVEDRILWTDKMDALAKILPEHIQLKSLNYSNRRSQGLQMEAAITKPMTAQSAVALVNKFVSILQEDEVFMKGFKTADVLYIRNVYSEQGAGTNFAIKCGS